MRPGRWTRIGPVVTVAYQPEVYRVGKDLGLDIEFAAGAALVATLEDGAADVMVAEIYAHGLTTGELSPTEALTEIGRFVQARFIEAFGVENLAAATQDANEDIRREAAYNG